MPRTCGDLLPRSPQGGRTAVRPPHRTRHRHAVRYPVPGTRYPAGRSATRQWWTPQCRSTMNTLITTHYPLRALERIDPADAAAAARPRYRRGRNPPRTCSQDPRLATTDTAVPLPDTAVPLRTPSRRPMTTRPGPRPDPGTAPPRGHPRSPHVRVPLRSARLRGRRQALGCRPRRPTPTVRPGPPPPGPAHPVAVSPRTVGDIATGFPRSRRRLPILRTVHR